MQGNVSIHTTFLQPDTWDQLDDARDAIRDLVALHASKTASTHAKSLLANWKLGAQKFVSPHTEDAVLVQDEVMFRN